MTPAEAYLEIKAHKAREDAYYGFWARVSACQINVQGPKKPIKPEDLYTPHLRPPERPKPEALTLADREDLKRRMEELAKKASEATNRK